MRQATGQSLNTTQLIILGSLTALLSLFQPIPTVFALQLTGLVVHESGRTGIQGKQIENIDQTHLYPTKSLEKKDSQVFTSKPHRLIRKPQNAPIASVEP